MLDLEVAEGPWAAAAMLDQMRRGPAERRMQAAAFRHRISPQGPAAPCPAPASLQNQCSAGRSTARGARTARSADAPHPGAARAGKGARILAIGLDTHLRPGLAFAGGPARADRGPGRGTALMPPAATHHDNGPGTTGRAHRPVVALHPRWKEETP